MVEFGSTAHRVAGSHHPVPCINLRALMCVRARSLSSSKALTHLLAADQVAVVWRPGGWGYWVVGLEALGVATVDSF